MDVSDGNWLQHVYNTVDLAAKLRYRYSGTTRAITYAYSEADNLPASVTFSSGKVTNGYDDLTRLTQRACKTNAGDDGVTVDYSYLTWEHRGRFSAFLAKGE